ncbi:hypothetical protein [Actinacidiphila acididurans]|uniref:Uncharacterized protein n=1 Tax=Actinacidiphila acididurans TaxID=2784346 RepID=A0ABS2U384_9ACTN|nr:hypothetical protein [Actinacidiphila acididurans]MBM9510064.1 hypothetical protein [Actinacidiphila acididurans]
MTGKPAVLDDYVPGRKYVVPVAPLDPATERVDRHLTVLIWDPGTEEWGNGVALCGRAVARGPATGEGDCCRDCITILNIYPRHLIEQE